MFIDQRNIFPTRRQGVARFRRDPWVVALLSLLMAVPALVMANPSKFPDELVGIWKAKKRFGPDARGPLVIQKTSSGWVADFVGRRVALRSDGTQLKFDLPSDQGSFSSRMPQSGRGFIGHWTPPPSKVHRYLEAIPVLLAADGSNRWRGEVVLTPREDTLTLYLKVEKRPDGTLGAFLRNPERNIGVQFDLDRLVLEGQTVKLIGKTRGKGDEKVLISGTYDTKSKLMSLTVPQTEDDVYQFTRDDDNSDFYPRGKNPGRYVYQPPLALDDGWPTATLDEARISRAGVEKLMQTVLDMPMASVHTYHIEAILVARHGKLVVEEYFHGFHRDLLHNTRSAAKSLTATVVGAAIQAGAPLKLSSPVYQVMNGGAFPPGLEPRKRAMTLEHLLMMRSGIFCDDSKPDSPGQEDVVMAKSYDARADFNSFYMQIPLDRVPGETSVYCSGDPNLALGMVSRATGESPMDTFDRLIGAPLKITRYGWMLDGAGLAYGGGSVQMTPRDFMKLGQLMLNGGTWNGHRILSHDFVERASASLHDLKRVKYGYLWWSDEVPYKNRKVHAFFAGGNGGQTVFVYPELDLVVANFAANYADSVALHIGDMHVNYLLPGVREAGDDMNAPVVEGHFSTPYGLPGVPNPK